MSWSRLSRIRKCIAYDGWIQRTLPFTDARATAIKQWTPIGTKTVLNGGIVINLFVTSAASFDSNEMIRSLRHDCHIRRWSPHDISIIMWDMPYMISLATCFWEAIVLQMQSITSSPRFRMKRQSKPYVEHNLSAISQTQQKMLSCVSQGKPNETDTFLCLP